MAIKVFGHKDVASSPQIPQIPVGTSTASQIAVQGKSRRGDWEARAWGGRSQLGYHNSTLKVIIMALVFALGYTNYAWWQHSTKLADRQWIVFHDRGGQTSSTNAAEFRTGASREEAENRAWEIVRRVIGAGSTNVDTYYAEAKAMMTPQMQGEFAKAIESKKDQIRQLNIYRKLEGVHIREAKPGDMPNGEKPNRYDVVVTGTLDTFRLESNEKIATGPFAFLVRMSPLDTRTIENPYGLLISGIAELNIADIEQKKEESTNPFEKKEESDKKQESGQQTGSSEKSKE
jgi:hypothetical protein